MLLLCFCALAGAYSLSIIPQLPSTNFFLASLLVSTAFLSFRKFRPATCFVIGAGVMGIASVAQLADRLDAALQGTSVTFSAAVETFPEGDGTSVRFLVRPLGRDDLPRRIRLSWFRPDSIPAIGETWRFHARLKRPRGYANPGGFDYEGWLFRERIGATGYVEASAPSYRIHGEPPGFVNRIRARFVARVASALPPDDAAAVLMAIGVGARHRIDSEHWDLYARTGTSHLMAISGLHIGLAASCAYLACWALFAPFCSRQNLRDRAIAGAIVAAVTYASLSGFAVPARRSLLMVLAAGLALLLRRRMRPSFLLAFPCLLVFITDPIAILTPGFKLSFSAVAILFLLARQHVMSTGAGRFPSAGTPLAAVRSLVRLQLALCTGLFPLTVLIFDRFALLAPVANMLVLPLFNFVTVPLTLLGALLDGPLEDAGQFVLSLAHGSIRAVLWLVTTLGGLEAASYATRHLGPVMKLVTLVPLIFVLLPPGWPGRYLAFVAVVAVLVHKPLPPPEGCLDYHVLDVGQGLAVVLQTHRHAMLFDTGPSFLSGSNTAEIVVLPYLYGKGIDRLDRLMISHGDLDHAGGARSIVTGTEVDDVLVGEELTVIDQVQRQCIAGQQWDWDGIAFEVIHPRHKAPWNRNNSSCVMQVEVGEFRLLLPGDIEAPAEKLLVHLKMITETDVVIVPHHGSKTSSSEPFVNATRAGLAIVSSGYRNRWEFPKPEVIARWRAAGANVLNTATAGAASQRICVDAGAGPVRLQRLAGQRYWHEVPALLP